MGKLTKKGIKVLLLFSIVLLALPIALANIDTSSNITITDNLFDILVTNNSLNEYNFTIIVNQNFTKLNITVNGNYSLTAAGANRTNNTLVDFSNTTDGTFNSFVWINNSAGGTSGGNFLINSTSQTATEADNNRITWTAAIMFVNGSTITQNFITVIDSLAPRVHRVNATDGNTTIWNRTSTGAGRLSALDTIGTANGGGILMADAPIQHTIGIEIEETHLRDASMYTMCNQSSSIDFNATLHPGQFKENQTIAPISTTAAIVPHLGNLSVSCVQEFQSASIEVNFAFYIYDLAGNVNNQNDTASVTTGRAYSYTAFQGHPNMTQLNITDDFGNVISSRTNLVNDSLVFLRGDSNYTLYVESAGAVAAGLGGSFAKLLTKPVNLTFFYTLNTTPVTNDVYEGSTIRVDNISSAEGDGPTNYNTTITQAQLNITEGNNYLNFVAIQNVTILGWAIGIIRGSIGIDGGLPDTTTSINKNNGRPSDKFTYSCGGTDLISGVANCKTTLTKPNGDQILRTSTTCDDQEFEGTDTSALGSYTLTCLVTDNVGLTKTSDETKFIISTSSGGGGGGSSGTSVNVDLSLDEMSEVLGQKGLVKTFTFGGLVHKLVFEDVGFNEATFRVESEPQFFTLKVGESKVLDLNNDDILDMKITLEQIKQGFAQILVTKFEEGASALVEEERIEIEREREAEELREVFRTEEVELPTPDIPINGATRQLLTWLVTAGVVAIIVAGYLVIHRKEEM